MNIQQLIKQAEKFTTDNSPLILTAIGAAGVITTAVLAAKGGMDAADRLADERDRRKWKRTDDGTLVSQTASEITIRDKVVLTWTCFAPACGAGALTVAAVIASNRVSTRRAAAMAAAYSISVEAFDEYKDKVREKMGARKEENVRNDVAQDRVNNNPPTKDNTFIVTHDGDQLFEDSWSGRYFRSNAESIHQAVNQLNHAINMHGHATLTDFYELLGLKKTRESDEIGWNADKLLEIYLDAVMHDDGKHSVLAIEYRVTPIRDYFRTR